MSWIDTRTLPPKAVCRPDDSARSAELLAEDQLIHLKSYRYQAVDKSLISNHILRHYWNFCVELLPRWLAPNAVTLLGFLCIMVNVVCLEIWMPDMIGPGPSWLYYSFAAGLWAYSTMDNIDGKQARRTGSSSPLGELFDHGIDSLNCTLASLLEVACMGLGNSPAGVCTALIPCLPMFFSTWETYHSHVLYLGYFNGPTEGLIIACTLMILSGYYGPQIWKYQITSCVPVPPALAEHLGTTTWLDLWIPLLIGSFTFAHLPACVYNVVTARMRRGQPVLPVFLEWTPMVVFTAGCLLWLGSPWTHLLRDNHLVLFCVTLSFVFGRMTTKIILAHLTKQPFPYWTVLLAPLVGGAALSQIPPRLGWQPVTAQFELVYLYGYCLFAIIVYFRWAVLVINAICGYLGIHCLRITPKDPTGVLNGSAVKVDKRVA